MLSVAAVICLLLLDAGGLLKSRGGPRIVAFVIDSASSMMEKERNTLDLFKDLTHGQVVRDILSSYGRPDELRFHDVDDMRGSVDKQRYLDVLALARSYLRQRPGDRVVVNISLGSHLPDPQETELITDIIELGAIVVAAAGNDGLKDSTYPAAIEGVICVGASAKGIRKDYSNYGNVDIFADGSYQTSQTVTLPSDIGMETRARTVELNGTSFAAPKVSGVIIKMLRLDPSLENWRILRILQDTSDDVIGFEQGSLNRLNALSAISKQYSVLKKTRNAFLVSLQAICVLVVVCAVFLIVIAALEFSFRVLLPSHWMAVKIRKIDRIMAGDMKRPGQIKYIIDCLYPGYSELFERAGGALLEIGEPAVPQLIRAYPYKPANEFGDFATCVHELIEKIGGTEAEEFLQAEQERQEDLP